MYTGQFFEFFLPILTSSKKDSRRSNVDSYESSIDCNLDDNFWLKRFFDTFIFSRLWDTYLKDWNVFIIKYHSTIPINKSHDCSEHFCISLGEFLLFVIWQEKV